MVTIVFACFFAWKEKYCKLNAYGIVGVRSLLVRLICVGLLLSPLQQVLMSVDRVSVSVRFRRVENHHYKSFKRAQNLPSASPPRHFDRVRLGITLFILGRPAKGSARMPGKVSVAPACTCSASRWAYLLHPIRLSHKLESKLSLVPAEPLLRKAHNTSKLNSSNASSKATASISLGSNGSS